MRPNQTDRPLQPAKSKTETLDWDRVLSSYRELDSLPGDLVASESEVERLLSVYNRALRQATTGNADVAMIALEKVTANWPQFAEASSLYGVLLARERRYRAAEEQFEKVLLAAPDTSLARTVDRCRLAAREERIREQARDSSKRRKEQKLAPVRAHMARSGILQRAADEQGTGRVQMAGRREQDEVLRMEEGLSPGARRVHGKVSRLVQGLLIAVIVSSVLFLVFYFVIRPMIVRNEARREQLEWLERILDERSEDAPVAEILDLYRRTFPQDSGK
ncbi:MAG: tetratricopeptide repeat protein [Clostridiaceae bacterium]|nr:tetratricopeptide repeat protein [Clostridiaceae bacterium]